MNRIALGLLLLAVVSIAFGWWGRATESGRRRFDEMAGMIPEFAYWAGLFLAGIAVL